MIINNSSSMNYYRLKAFNAHKAEQNSSKAAPLNKPVQETAGSIGFYGLNLNNNCADCGKKK